MNVMLMNVYRCERKIRLEAASLDGADIEGSMRSDDGKVVLSSDLTVEVRLSRRLVP